MDLRRAGLGLGYTELTVSPTTEAWVLAGSQLRSAIGGLLRGLAVDVEQIGSSSVIGLLAKPIIDLAVGVPPTFELDALTSVLTAHGWIYRGDASDHGGHVFVLESEPWHRVAHLHVIEHNGQQWRNYLVLRDILRRSPEARARYEAVKLRLVREGVDRATYTDGKSAVIRELLALCRSPSPPGQDCADGDGTEPDPPHAP